MPTNVANRPRRRTTAVVVALLAALALVAGACSDDESGSGDEERDRTTTSTTAEGSDSGETEDGADGEETSPGEEGEPQEFSGVIAELSERLRDAGNDRCALLQIYMGMGATATEPKTPEEVQEAVTFTSDWLIAMAESLPPEQSAQAEVMRNTAEQFQEEARSLDYSPEAMAQDSPQALQTPEFEEAMGGVMRGLSSECAPATPGN